VRAYDLEVMLREALAHPAVEDFRSCLSIGTIHRYRLVFAMTREVVVEAKPIYCHAYHKEQD
jgi:hypothetical protein